MSQPDDLDQPSAPRPRRPKPKPADDPPPNPARAGFGEDSFRPNPGAAGGRVGSGRKTAGELKTETAAAGPKWHERILFGRVSSGQLSQFCRQFASYLHAGVDYDRALSSLGRQYKGTALGPVVERVRARIKSGSTLEDATRPEQDVFGPLFQTMIAVAEARGGVPETLRSLSATFEARQRLIRQARSAMIYPVIVLVLGSTIACLMAIYILPMFADLLSDISKKAQLPWASRAMMAFSRYVSGGGWWILPIALIGTPLAFLRWHRTAAGKAALDPILLRVPVLGAILRKLDVGRFARTLSSLLDAGVDVGTSMDLTARAMSTTPMRNAVEAARAPMMDGLELSDSLSRSRWFGPDVIAVIESGEETGKLPESLNHLADDYEEQVAHMVKNLGQLIQPLLVLMLAGLVLFIILAVFLPYIQLITTLAGG